MYGKNKATEQLAGSERGRGAAGTEHRSGGAEAVRISLTEAASVTATAYGVGYRRGQREGYRRGRSDEWRDWVIGLIVVEVAFYLLGWGE